MCPIVALHAAYDAFVETHSKVTVVGSGSYEMNYMTFPLRAAAVFFAVIVVTGCTDGSLVANDEVILTPADAGTAYTESIFASKQPPQDVPFRAEMGWVAMPTFAPGLFILKGGSIHSAELTPHIGTHGQQTIAGLFYPKNQGFHHDVIADSDVYLFEKDFDLYLGVV